MALIKRRPSIKLFAPNEIVAGAPFQLRTILECEEAVPVDGLSIELVGEGVWYSSSQYGRHRNAVAFVRRVARPIRGRRELQAGHHAFVGAFDLPQEVPGSYPGRTLRVEWTVQVHVDIPWWPDAHATFTVWVRSQPTRRAVDQRVFVSDANGPRGRKPYAEVSLASTEIDSGGRILGRIALGNTVSNEYRAVRFALVALERIPGLLSSWTDHNRVTTWTIPIEQPQENEPIDFILRAPEGLVPGFATRKLELQWFLEVRLDIPWSIDTKMWIPVTVLPARGDPGHETAQPLAVGSERMALVWARAAAQTGFNLVDGELSREIGICRVTIRREHRGRRGHCLIAEARFRDLGIGLDGDSGRLRCRDPGQSEVLAEHLDALLTHLEISEADDERILCERDDSGARVRRLIEFVQQFETLIRAFEDLRTRLPPPRDMADLVPDFRSACRQLGGELDLASMDIRGFREEMPFSLETHWSEDGSPSHILLHVRPLIPIDGRYQQAWDGQREPTALPDGMHALLEGAHGMSIDAEGMGLIFPARAANLERLVGRLEGLIAVGLRLSGRGGRYR